MSLLGRLAIGIGARSVTRIISRLARDRRKYIEGYKDGYAAAKSGKRNKHAGD